MSEIYAVTGSASGIGKAVAELLRSQGHKVIGIDIKDADIIADLATVDGRNAAVRAISEVTPDGLNGFIPCAGIGGFMGLSEQLVEVNYFGSVDLLEALYPALKMRRGVVVVIGSNSMAMPGQDKELIQLLLAGERESAKQYVTDNGIEPYPSAKTALCIWMRHQAVKWMTEGVRMNAIAPGITETGMVAAQRQTNEMLATQLADFASSSPAGHAADPQSIADVIGFLLSPSAHFICGEVLYADGGHAAGFRPEHV